MYVHVYRQDLVSSIYTRLKYMNFQKDEVLKKFFSVLAKLLIKKLWWFLHILYIKHQTLAERKFLIDCCHCFLQSITSVYTLTVMLHGARVPCTPSVSCRWLPPGMGTSDMCPTLSGQPPARAVFAQCQTGPPGHITFNSIRHVEQCTFNFTSTSTCYVQSGGFVLYVYTRVKW